MQTDNLTYVLRDVDHGIADSVRIAAADRIEALEAWQRDIERKICAAEHGHNINDVLANYRAIRRKIQDDRAARRLVEKEDGR